MAGMTNRAKDLAKTSTYPGSLIEHPRTAKAAKTRNSIKPQI